MHTQTKILLWIVVIIIIIVGLVAVFAKPNVLAPNGNNEIACTMDAKICPDGTAVGRVGPNCEFAPCPGE
ncbi:MAG: hypothetical protein AAB460_03505 [Patescibacteria group bacterium]